MRTLTVMMACVLAAGMAMAGTAQYGVEDPAVEAAKLVIIQDDAHVITQDAGGYQFSAPIPGQISTLIASTSDVLESNDDLLGSTTGNDVVAKLTFTLPTATDNAKVALGLPWGGILKSDGSNVGTGGVKNGLRITVDTDDSLGLGSNVVLVDIPVNEVVSLGNILDGWALPAGWTSVYSGADGKIVTFPVSEIDGKEVSLYVEKKYLGGNIIQEWYVETETSGKVLVLAVDNGPGGLFGPLFNINYPGFFNPDSAGDTNAHVYANGDAFIQNLSLTVSGSGVPTTNNLPAASTYALLALCMALAIAGGAVALRVSRARS